MEAAGIYSTFRRLVFLLDPETAHHLTLGLLRWAGALAPARSWLRSMYTVDDPGLAVSSMGLEFPNPVGLAAGYDKDGRALDGLACLGFSHVELGTVTPQPQPGNPRPRVFRLVQDEALINRMGFPNAGAATLARRLGRWRRRSAWDGLPRLVVGVNLGKGAETPLEEAAGDYRALVRTFHPLADYLVVNVSSPNTPRLRRLQDPAALRAVLRDVQAECRSQEAKGAGRTPVLVKLAPDLEQAEVQGAVEAALAARVDGIIATNTTLRREALVSRQRAETGGLSGRPLRSRSTQVLEQVSRLAEGRLTLIGVGGVTDAASAREKLDSGASLVQVFSGLVYRGPGLAAEILRALRSGRPAAPR